MPKTIAYKVAGILFIMAISIAFILPSKTKVINALGTPKAVLIPTEKFYFNSLC